MTLRFPLRFRSIVRRTALGTLLGCILPLSVGATDSEVVAKIGDEVIHLSEAEATVQAELAELDSRRHAILEAAIDRLVSDRLLEIDAEARGLPLDSILAEIEAEAEATPVTDAEVDRWYQQNQARIRAPKAQVSDQIRTYLENENRARARAAKVAQLQEKYGAEVLLEPMRFDLHLEDAPSYGPSDAAVTLVEYGDFECPPCGRLHGELKKLKAEYGDRVRFVFEHFPLESIHPNARAASRAAFCAGEQGEFWGMHDALFENQRSLNEATYLAHAAELGLDRDAFAGCLASDEANAAVDRDLADGRGVGVGGTPSLFVNGRRVHLAGDPYQSLKAELEKELGR
ncbi:MAG: thioredoxin domain-containing protein [Thermoanaerobaculia bacterium]|nr:thioredoxin domain-containing protein [Thermoanaerobaculia bacterium]